MKISVLGAGGWGTTLSILLHFNGHKISLWEFDKSYYKSLIRHRENKLFLPGIEIPEEIEITHNLEENLNNKNLIVLAVPAQYLRSVIRKINYTQIKNSILINLAKGIETKTLLTMSQMLQDEIPQLNPEQIGTLSGPSHAEEVSRRIATAVVAASVSESTSKNIQAAFMNSYFRVYSSTDILGVELGGSVKNVIAIGAGIIDGAKFGDNTKAAIMTRGVA
jgi:glycerol-3-phosphate dehydrogenase (NAD(P)+)